MTNHVFKCMGCGREWDVHSTSKLDCFFRGLCYDCLMNGYEVWSISPDGQFQILRRPVEKKS